MTTILTTRYVHKAPFMLDGLALTLPDVYMHPNRAEFSGVLTRVDEPSTRPPNGSAGHKVLISRRVAEEALPSLIGMGVNCSEDFSDHAKQLKLGVITEAHIDGQNLCISGHLYEKDFPGQVAFIRTNKARMGASYEIADCSVFNTNADIWELDHFVFTGAAILFKDKAAYQNTAIAATTEEFSMPDATEILDKLNTINVKLDMAAAHDANAEEAAAKQDEADAAALDEEAVAAERSADAARADNDAQDASKHDETASAKRLAASAKRLAATQRYEALAAQAKEASDTDAVATHTAAVTRLQAAHTAQQALVTKVEAAREQWAAKAKTKTQDASSDERMMKLFGMFVTAMNATEDDTDAAHDDEEDDKELFKKMFKKKGEQKASTTTTDLQTRRWQRNMEASMQLLTDTVAKMTGLITDVEARTRGLATDAHRGNNGGPVRRTMAATGTERWTGKFDEKEPKDDKKVTTESIHAAATAEGLSPRESMARTLRAAEQGILQ